MIKYLRLTGLMLALSTLCACNIKKGEDPCPVQTVNVRLFAEVFQNPDYDDPMHETELNFYSRISHLTYFLYKDGVLVGEFRDNVIGIASSHPLLFPDLEYADYRLVVMANTKKNGHQGTAEECASLQLHYPGYADTEDFFYRVFDFTVDSEEETTYDVGIFRAHGFVRLSFVHMPDFIDKFRVRIGNVTKVKELEGGFITRHDEAHDYTYNVIEVADGYIVGTFPTMTDQYSAIHIDLYDENNPDEPYYSETAGTTLEMVRNQLLDIRMTFNDGSTDFEVSLNTDWDGVLFPGGGGIELN